MISDKKKYFGIRRIVILSVLVALLLSGLNAFLGDLNQDEGWYIYASSMIGRGSLPYRDFAFTQAPVMPFFYLSALPFVDLWGMLGARIFTIMLAFAAAGVSAWAAARLAPSEKGATAAATLILLLVNCYHSYFTSVAKTYAITTLFLAAGTLFLGWVGTKRGAVTCLLSGIFYALAIGTRMSIAPVVPVVFGWLIWKRRRQEAGNEWAGFAFGSLTTLAMIILPFLSVAHENFIYFNFDYHMARDVGGIGDALIYKLGFISRWIGAYSIAALIGMALLFHKLAKRNKSSRVLLPFKGRSSDVGFLWIAAGSITIVHLMAPFPYDDYQVAVFPLFAIALAVDGVQLVLKTIRSKHTLRVYLLGLLFASTLAAFSSPINQSWFVFGRDRIWWLSKSRPDILNLRDAGRMLRDYSGRRTGIITQDTYLAVESGLQLPHGMEMGPFSFYPDLATHRARQLNVLNEELLLEILGGEDAPVAAVSGYSFAIAAPSITPVPDSKRLRFIEILLDSYEKDSVIENFGQAHTDLIIYRRR